MFLKQNADILSDHRNKNYEIELLEGKQSSFVQNYKLLLEQEIDAIKKYIDKHLLRLVLQTHYYAVAIAVQTAIAKITWN